MQTLHLTIEEPLLQEVDRLTAALQAAIRKHAIALLEKQHKEGYERHPVEPGEFDICLSEQAWNKE